MSYDFNYYIICLAATASELVASDQDWSWFPFLFASWSIFISCSHHKYARFLASPHVWIQRWECQKSVSGIYLWNYSKEKQKYLVMVQEALDKASTLGTAHLPVSVSTYTETWTVLCTWAFSKIVFINSTWNTRTVPCLLTLVFNDHKKLVRRNLNALRKLRYMPYL